MNTRAGLKMKQALGSLSRLKLTRPGQLGTQTHKRHSCTTIPQLDVAKLVRVEAGLTSPSWNASQLPVAALQWWTRAQLRELRGSLARSSWIHALQQRQPGSMRRPHLNCQRGQQSLLVNARANEGS